MAFSALTLLVGRQALQKVMAAYHWVYDSLHLQAGCHELG